MANDISFRVITKPFEDATHSMDRAVQRATMYALRTQGRAVIKAAKPAAPVYKGTDARALAESGNLKKSIRNARLITKLANGNYYLRTGPTGTKKAGTAVVRHGSDGAKSSRKAGTSTKGQVRGVKLYRAAMEEKYGYMAKGIAAVSGPGGRKIYEDAYAKALAKYGGR